MTAAGLDMNLAGPSQLQTTPGLLLTDPHSSGHGHKRPRTSNDDDDPSGRHGRPDRECAEPRAPFMLLFPAHLLTASMFLNAGDSPHPNGERKAKGPYFEFAKKKWETEDTFRYLPTHDCAC